MKTALKWIAKPSYNRFDPLWIGLVALAWHDGHYLAVAVFATSGALISGVIEHFAKPRV